MKLLWMVLLVVAVGLVPIGLMGVGGCARMPEGVASCLYTAEITLGTTVAEVDSGRVWPYRGDPNETPEAELGRLRVANQALVGTMRQADKNLVEVVGWVRGKAVDPNAR